MKNQTLIVNYGKTELDVNQIKYIESVAGNYSKIVFQQGKPFVSAFTLKHYSSQLLATQRFHLGRKGLLINLDYLKKLEEKQATKYAVLKTGEKFKLSRRIGRKLDELLQAG